jgi:hypothetical protein
MIGHGEGSKKLPIVEPVVAGFQRGQQRAELTMT